MWHSNHAGRAQGIETEYRVKEKARPFFLRRDDHDTVAILVHGFTGSPYDMKELAEYLFDNGIDVYVVRLAGHGTSPYDLMHTTYRDWLSSVDDAVRTVSKTHKRIFLIGYSFGANLILHLAARDTKEYAGLVCLGTSIFLRMSNGKRRFLYVLNYMMRVVGFKKSRKWYVPKNTIAEFEIAGNYAYIPLKSMIHFNSFIHHHTKQDVPQVTTPILIIHSREDKVSHPRSSQYLFENVRSIVKEMFILPEQQHNPLKANNSDRIFDRVLDFVQG